LFSGHAKKGTTKSIWGRERCSVQQKGPDAGFTELQSQVGWIVRPFSHVMQGPAELAAEFAPQRLEGSITDFQELRQIPQALPLA
jgi:hypothetical protein